VIEMALDRGSAEPSIRNPGEQLVSRLVGYCREIDPADLLDGELVAPHLSLLEGLGSAVSTSAVAAMLSRLPVVPVTLGKVRSYRHPGYDLLAIEAESDDLAKLYRAMVKHVPGADECEYDPRVILCKLKPGTGKDYSGDDRFEGEVLTLASASVCGQDGTREAVRLLAPRKKVEFVGQEKVKGAPPAAKIEAPAPAVDPLRVERVPDPQPGPAIKDITLKSCWAGLTRDARDDLRRLRDRGTDAAIRKACRVVRHATADRVSRGLLIDWLAKGWDPGPDVGGGKRRWTGNGPDKGKTRYQISPPGSRSRGKQSPGGEGGAVGGTQEDDGQQAGPQQEQEVTEGQEKPQEKPAPAKKPAAPKAGKPDPEDVGRQLDAMVKGEIPADSGKALEMLMTLTVKQAQTIRDAMDLDAAGTKGTSRNVIPKIAAKFAARIAEMALAGKLAKSGEASKPAEEPAPEPEQAAPAPAPAPEPKPEQPAPQEQAGYHEAAHPAEFLRQQTDRQARADRPRPSKGVPAPEPEEEPENPIATIARTLRDNPQGASESQKADLVRQINSMQEGGLHTAARMAGVKVPRKAKRDQVRAALLAHAGIEQPPKVDDRKPAPAPAKKPAQGRNFGWREQARKRQEALAGIPAERRRMLEADPGPDEERPAPAPAKREETREERVARLAQNYKRTGRALDA
jgi:hypothetical protein